MANGSLRHRHRPGGRGWCRRGHGPTTDLDSLCCSTVTSVAGAAVVDTQTTSSPAVTLRRYGSAFDRHCGRSDEATRKRRTGGRWCLYAGLALGTATTHPEHDTHPAGPNLQPDLRRANRRRGGSDEGEPTHRSCGRRHSAATDTAADDSDDAADGDSPAEETPVEEAPADEVAADEVAAEGDEAEDDVAATVWDVDPFGSGCIGTRSSGLWFGELCSWLATTTVPSQHLHLCVASRGL